MVWGNISIVIAYSTFRAGCPDHQAVICSQSLVIVWIVMSFWWPEEASEHNNRTLYASRSPCTDKEQLSGALLIPNPFFIVYKRSYAMSLRILPFSKVYAYQNDASVCSNTQLLNVGCNIGLGQLTLQHCTVLYIRSTNIHELTHNTRYHHTGALVHQFCKATHNK